MTKTMTEIRYFPLHISALSFHDAFQDEELEGRFKSLEENMAKEEKLRKDLEANNAKLLTEKQQLALQLEQEREALAESEERSAKLLSQKSDIERQVRRQRRSEEGKEWVMKSTSEGPLL